MWSKVEAFQRAVEVRTEEDLLKASVLALATVTATCEELKRAGARRNKA